jgi:hypothetical protein
MITRKWPGTKAGCDCSKNPDYDDVIIKDKGCPSNCEEIEAISKQTMNSIFGRIICIKRSGTSIVHAERPEDKDGKPSFRVSRINFHLLVHGIP